MVNVANLSSVLQYAVPDQACSEGVKDIDIGRNEEPVQGVKTSTAEKQRVSEIGCAVLLPRTSLGWQPPTKSTFEKADQLDIVLGVPSVLTLEGLCRLSSHDQYKSPSASSTSKAEADLAIVVHKKDSKLVRAAHILHNSLASLASGHMVENDLSLFLAHAFTSQPSSRKATNDGSWARRLSNRWQGLRRQVDEVTTPEGPWRVCTRVSEKSGKQKQGDSSALSSRMRRSTVSDANDLAAAERRLSVKDLNGVLAHSRAGLCSLKGSKQIPNQDRASVVSFPQVGELLAVFDGHGAHGHMVSDFCAQHLPQLFLRGLAASLTDTGAGTDRLNAAVWKQEVKDAFETTQEALEEITWQYLVDSGNDESSEECTRFDARSSGTTATLAWLLEDGGAVLAHVGDSKAVLGVRPRESSIFKKNSWSVRDLTTDHKPIVAEERQRIFKAGAQVVSQGGGSYRVRSPGQHWPALNMTRSLGDLHTHTQGVIATPDVTVNQCMWTPAKEEAILIMASDGLWDVMSGEEAVKFAARYSPREAANALAQEALARWKKEAKKARLAPYS
eukprot:CAMPEP_0178422818 /NCGR_PEP_ID=MMETSP0689_2-20121128/27371_1 /TAXON_ID=160604 /ORGANISM="Amphidinium massartii, Strain CS-259" /LENGTH=558 /DNA_ID=CAMNT_0020044397 /DNA_START=35 /DNA_END=1707 /DNA_ORIENTATION=-